MTACFCTGPQNGEELCPCQMAAAREADLTEWKNWIATRRKPRVRVKALSRWITLPVTPNIGKYER